MDDLITKHIFDSQASWFIDVLGLLFDMLSTSGLQPGTGRRPIDLSRNYIYLLYFHIKDTMSPVPDHCAKEDDSQLKATISGAIVCSVSGCPHKTL